MDYSFVKTLGKSAKQVGILVAIAGVGALLSPDVAEQIKASPYGALLLPVLQGAAVGVLDWLKHRKD